MTTSYTSRPIANLPPSHSHAASRSHPQQPQQTPRIPMQTPYNPNPAELQPGARNRLFLALRSEIESEVDWCLPRLVLGSYDHAEVFKLDQWPESVSALLTYPMKWLEEVEKESTLYILRNRRPGQGEDGDKDKEKEQAALGIVSDWTRDLDLESRAINSLLILRNASFTSTNAKSICRSDFIDLVARFFSMPVEFLLEMSLRQPEPLQHLFVLIQSTFPYLQQTAIGSSSPTNGTTATRRRSETENGNRYRNLLQAFSKTLPTMIVETRDAGILHNLLPILIAAFQIPNIPPPPPTLIPYLLKTMTLNPPAPMLDLCIDLLISLSQNSVNCRTILSDPSFPAHLRHMVLLLEHGAKKTQAAWDAPGQVYGVVVPNPASTSGQLEQATKRRKVEREKAQRTIEAGNPMGVVVQVGDRPPVMSAIAKRKLHAMPEPARAIHWMHENFVYCSTSTVLQVTFWHAYRDFFSTLATQDPMLSASEVIKNVTVAFPCASPKVIKEPTGENKFVIWGLGWRKGADENQRFSCHWNECSNAHDHSNAVQLLDHVRSAHLPESTICAWGTCQQAPLTLSHLLTHLPLTNSSYIPEQVTIHPSVTLADDPFANILRQPPPPLSRHYKLHFTGSMTATDARRHPIGVAYLTSLLLRNVARTLRSDLTSALPDAALSAEDKAERRKHLQQERFGLPIPDTVLKEEEEEEEKLMAGGKELIPGQMTKEEMERAREAFETVEERVLEVIEVNMSGLNHYLGECFGFGALGGW